MPVAWKQVCPYQDIIYETASPELAKKRSVQEAISGCEGKAATSVTTESLA